MHGSESDDGLPTPTVSQAEADRCCASSERDEAAPSSSTVVLSGALALLPTPVGLELPATTRPPYDWRTPVPFAGTHISRHLLLSVLLV
jgi:hypothetical protein